MNMPTTLGRYELVRKIAAGGMAEIFLARSWSEARFFRDVVIKRLFTTFAHKEEVVSMFHYEAHLLAHLCHPNIPQVYDLGSAHGTWFVAMEFVDGWTVADLWRAGARARKPMPLHVALGIVMQACEALHHAHEAKDRAGRALNIVHRDVTPHNLMVTRDGVAKLMDFGVAKTDARPKTESGALKGTFSYMAPEQVRGREVDRRVDVFALGVILYEITTGTRLFRGTNSKVMTDIVEKDAPPPSTVLPDYPADLEEIVLAALRRDRRARIASAADFALHLEYFAMRHGLPIGPRSIAEWINEVYPTEKVAEDELAIVPEAAPPGVEVPAVGVSELPPPMTDPAPVHDLESVIDDTTDAFRGEGSSVQPARDLAADESVEDVDVDELEEEEPISVGIPSNEPSDAPAPLRLDGFEEGEEELSEERPVVLLDAKKKPESEDEGYLRSLEQRLADEDG